MDSATPKPKARSQPFVGLAAKGPRKSDLLGHTLRPVPLLAGGESPRVRRAPPRRRDTRKGRDARGARPPPRLPRRGRGDSRQLQAPLGGPKEDGGGPFFRQDRPEEAHQARGRDRRRVVAKTSLTVVQRAEAPCKTTVEKPRRSCRGFSLSRVFSLAIGNLVVSSSGLEPGTWRLRVSLHMFAVVARCSRSRLSKANSSI